MKTILSKVTPTKTCDPRPYLECLDDTNIRYLGEFDPDGFSAGCDGAELELWKSLNRVQRSNYEQARREGFQPVIQLDVLTGVVALEMRKHSFHAAGLLKTAQDASNISMRGQDIPRTRKAPLQRIATARQSNRAAKFAKSAA